jgi:NarL family two-component system response regulator LiaR
MQSIRVLIVDDHAVVRQGLRTFLESEEDIVVVGEASDGEEAVRRARDLAPDVVVMDLVMPGMDGIIATQKIGEVSPGSRVLALTSFSEDDKVFPAKRAGAKGYMLKDVPAEDLGRAIRSLARGEFLLHGEIANRVLDEFRSSSREEAPSLDRLTPRELDVLTLIARGRSNKQIAHDLTISIKTVKTHVGNILSKLHMMDRTQAALYAVRQGLVPGEED